MNLVEKYQALIENVRLHWKTPAPGRYMNFKEIASLAGGGIGIKMVVTIAQVMILSTGNFLIGNVIGIAPQPMYVIYMISVLCGFPLTMVRAKIIDSTRGKKGKYRPYILSMGILTSILAIAFVWMPYEAMDRLTTVVFGSDITQGDVLKCAVVLIINIGFQFCYNFFYDAYDNYVVVLSSNTQERADVSAIRAVTDSFAPSIYNIIIPLFAKWITGANTLNDIRIYRYALPPIIIISMLVGTIVYTNTREKIIQAKTHVAQMKFVDALREVAKNKYFWIISLAGWIGFLESAYGVILSWLYSYQAACGTGDGASAKYALITTIYGNASLWGMLMAPFLIKKIGKKKVLVYTNFLNIIFIAALWPSIMYGDPTKVIWLALIFLFANGVVGSFAHILNPSLNGDIRDYQQYVSGERIDGMFAAVGLIGSVITLATGSVLPALYEDGGINKATLTQYQQQIVGIMTERNIPVPENLNTYDVLYIPEIFKNVLGVLIIASVIGAFMNVVPYFFYDLTELKQQAIVKVLKVRALFEDYGNNALRDEELVEAIDLVEHSREMAEQTEKNVDKKNTLKKVKNDVAGLSKKERKAKIKQVKKELEANKEFNDDIYISKFVIKELEKFNNPFGIHQYELCKAIAAEGFNGIKDADINIFKEDLRKAKLLPTNTEDEKEFRKFEVSMAKNRILSKKYMDKYYKDVLPIQPDAEAFSEKIKLYEAKDEELVKVNIAKSDARKKKESEKVQQLNAKSKQLAEEIKQLDTEIKDYMEEECKFNRATKAYYAANKLLTQYENYQHFNDIADMYEESKARAEQAAREKEEAAARLKAETEAQKEKLKAEKAAKKAEKKTEKKSEKTEKTDKKASKADKKSSKTDKKDK